MDLVRLSPALTRNQKLAVVSVEEVKAQARIVGSEDNDLVAAYIEAAYDYLSGPEGWLGHCCLLAEQWQYRDASLDADEVELPMRPYLGGVDYPLTFGSWDGAAYTDLAASAYLYAERGLFPAVYRLGYTPWPSVTPPFPQAYQFTFWAGFGDTRAAIPSPIRQAIRMLAAYWYNQRETVGSEGKSVGSDVLYGLRALCGRYRIANDHS